MHYIKLHYIRLHYIRLHYITLHYITLHYITLHYITLRSGQHSRYPAETVEVQIKLHLIFNIINQVNISASHGLVSLSKSNREISFHRNLTISGILSEVNYLLEGLLYKPGEFFFTQIKFISIYTVCVHSPFKVKNSIANYYNYIIM